MGGRGEAAKREESGLALSESLKILKDSVECLKKFLVKRGCEVSAMMASIMDKDPDLCTYNRNSREDHELSRQ